MAIVGRFSIGVQVWDSATLLASVAIPVSETDYKAYAAAANQAARDATDAGILVIAALDMTAAHGSTHYKKWFTSADYVNDAATPEPKDDQIYNTNQVGVTYTTTDNGVPVIETIYVPLRRDDFTLFGSNPVQVDFSGAGAAKDFADALVATGLGSHGAAITGVTKMYLNDS